MRYGTLDDAVEKDGTRWLQMLIQKHHIYLVHTAKTTVLHFITGIYLWKLELENRNFPNKNFVTSRQCIDKLSGWTMPI